MLYKIGTLLLQPKAKLVLLALAIIFPFLAGNEYQIYVMSSAFVWEIGRAHV